MEWTAWEHTRALTFLHNRVRAILLAQGVEEQTIATGGTQVHLYAAGPKDAARTVVLLHGLGDSAHAWFRALPLLAWRGDRVIAIDLPGHGFTPPPDERGFVQPSEHAEIVRHILDTLAVGETRAVVGHSLGGWVAARAALSDVPFDQLVLVEAAGLEHEGMWESIDLLRIEHEQDVRRFFRTVAHTPPFGSGLVTREIAAMFRTPAVFNFLDHNDPREIIKDTELRRIQRPTTIIWGENDGLVPPVVAQRWHAGIRNSSLEWIPKCGHTPHFERPLLFQRKLEAALGHAPVATAIRDRLTAALPRPFRRADA